MTASVSELRYNGYCAALRDNGIAFDPARSSPRPAAALKCRRATPACAALSTAAWTSPAVFTLSDTMAISAMKGT